MIARLLVAWILTVSLVISVTGCSRWRNRHANRTVEPQQPTPAVQQSGPEQAPPKPDAMQADAQAGTPEALAQKTNSYAQTLAALLEKRQNEPGPTTAPSASAAQTPQSDQSAVKWVDPNDVKLTDATAAQKPLPTPAANPTTGAPVEPVIDKGTGAANQALAFNTTDSSATAKAIAKSNARPAPTTPAAAATWDQKLARQAKDSPRDVGVQLDQQLLHFLQDEPVPQIADLASLPTEDRELVSAVMDAMSNFRSAVRADGNMLLSKKIRPFLEMSERMRTSADLSIPTVALCTRVDGYGIYEPLDAANRFSAGKEHPLIVYCEVVNFSSQLNDKKLWETKLTQEIVLYTETGLPVWQDKTKTITDTCRNRRHDFFTVKRIDLPANLTIGRYLLKVGVVDQQASRVSEATVPIIIVAQ